jgi:hypothetical protein
MTQNIIRQFKGWDIEIKFFDRGCVVIVGCKSFAFESIEQAMADESIEQAMAELVAYTKDPIGVGMKYAPEDFVELRGGL